MTVADLDNQIAFYQEALGFRLHWREGKRAGLGAGGADLLVHDPSDNGVMLMVIYPL